MTALRRAAVSALAAAAFSLAAPAAAAGQTADAEEYRPCPDDTTHVRLVLALDRSGSLVQEDPGGDNRREAVEKLRELLTALTAESDLTIQVALLSFDTEAVIHQMFRDVGDNVPSDDFIDEAVADGIGDTHYEDAILESLQLFGQDVETSGVVCNLLVWFTDGILDPLNTVPRYGNEPSVSSGVQDVIRAEELVNSLGKATCPPGQPDSGIKAELDTYSVQTYALLLGEAFRDTDTSKHRGWMTDKSLAWISSLTNDPVSPLTGSVNPLCGDEEQTGETEDEQTGLVINLENIGQLLDEFEKIPPYIVPETETETETEPEHLPVLPPLTCDPSAEAEVTSRQEGADGAISVVWEAQTGVVCRPDDSGDPPPGGWVTDNSELERKTLRVSGCDVSLPSRNPVWEPDWQEADGVWGVVLTATILAENASRLPGVAENCVGIVWDRYLENEEIIVSADFSQLVDTSQSVLCGNDPLVNEGDTETPDGPVSADTGCVLTAPVLGTVTVTVEGGLSIRGGGSVSWGIPTGEISVRPGDDPQPIRVVTDGAAPDGADEDSIIEITAVWTAEGVDNPRESVTPVSLPVRLKAPSNDLIAVLLTVAALAAAAALTWLAWWKILSRRACFTGDLLVWDEAFDVVRAPDGGLAAPGLDAWQSWAKKPAMPPGWSKRVLPLGHGAELRIVRPFGFGVLLPQKRLAVIASTDGGEGWRFRVWPGPVSGDGEGPSADPRIELPEGGRLGGAILVGVQPSGSGYAGRVWGIKGPQADSADMTRRANVQRMFQRIARDIDDSPPGAQDASAPPWDHYSDSVDADPRSAGLPGDAGASAPPWAQRQAPPADPAAPTGGATPYDASAAPPPINRRPPTGTAANPAADNPAAQPIAPTDSGPGPAPPIRRRQR